MLIYDKIYGKFNIKDKVIIDIIKTKEMQRLKSINQYGSWFIVNKKFNTSRFEHSIGVFLVLRKFNCTIEEQIAGLIHDVSHTAFSHVVDYIYNQAHLQDKHHDFHDEIINKSEIKKILAKHGFNIKRILDESNFKILEKELPDLCADRIDYLLRDSFLIGLAKRKDIDDIINGFIIRNNEIIFKNKDAAKKAAWICLKANYMLWTNVLQSASYQLLADAIKIALEKRIIKNKDLHSTDKELLSKLMKSKNKEILRKINLIKKGRIIEDKDNYDFHTKGKARYIDPKIIINGRIKRVSEIDSKYKRAIKEFKKYVNNGFYIRIKD